MLHLFIVDAVITVKTIAKATVSSKAGWCDCFLIFFGGGGVQDWIQMFDMR